MRETLLALLIVLIVALVWVSVSLRINNRDFDLLCESVIMLNGMRSTPGTSWPTSLEFGESLLLLQEHLDQDPELKFYHLQRVNYLRILEKLCRSRGYDVMITFFPSLPQDMQKILREN